MRDLSSRRLFRVLFFFLFVVFSFALVAHATTEGDGECRATGALGIRSKGRRKFRRIEKRSVYRTLKGSRQNALALFATEWDGTADKIEEVVEAALANLTQASSTHNFDDDSLRSLDLLRYDVTYRDAKKLHQKYGLLSELPCTFYFRNESSYVFSQSHTLESVRFSLSRIRSMKDDDNFPLQRLETRDQLSSVVDSREISFIFLDLPKQETKEEKEKGQAAAATTLSLEGLEDYNDDDAEGEVDWDKVWERVLKDEVNYQNKQGEKDLVTNTREDVYGQFVELAGKNLLSPNVLFCYTNQTEVLPQTGFVSDEDAKSKENFLVYAFHGESVLDVFTPGCPCPFVSWLRSIVRTRNLVTTVTDAQFWDQLSEQVDSQRQWLVAQEERKLRQKIEETRGGGGSNDNNGPNEKVVVEEEEIKYEEEDASSASNPNPNPNTYEVEVVLLQSDQLSEEQARDSKDFKSFQIAVGKILLRKSNLVEVCSKNTEASSCEDSTEAERKQWENDETDHDGSQIGSRVYTFFHLPYMQDIWRGSLAAMLELSDFPCVMLFDTRHKLYYKLQPRSDLKGFSDPAEIIEFVQSHRQNALKPYVRSQVLGEEEGDTGRRGGNGSEGAMIESTNVMRFGQDTGMSKERRDNDCKQGHLLSAVLFHVTYCSFCKRALGIFREVKKLSHSYETLQQTKFLSLDCDRNDCYPSILNVTGASFDKLPVLVLFPCKRDPVIYDGAFKVNNILTNILEIK
jgi:hypothetical protein